MGVGVRDVVASGAAEIALDRPDGCQQYGGGSLVPLGWPQDTKKESADKPGSVVGSHSSGAHVTVLPLAAYPGAMRATSWRPYLALLRVGFTLPRCVATRAVRSYRTFSPLPVPGLTGHRRYIFCGTGRRLTPPRRYLAPCPVEPGLSSISPCLNEVYSDCLADSANIISYIFD